MACTALCELVGDEALGGDAARGNFAIDRDCHAVCIDTVEVFPIDLLDDIEADGRDAKAAYGFSVGEFFNRELGEGAPNSAGPLYVAIAFSRLDSLKRSRSFVIRSCWLPHKRQAPAR